MPPKWKMTRSEAERLIEEYARSERATCPGFSPSTLAHFAAAIGEPMHGKALSKYIEAKDLIRKAEAARKK